LPLKKLKVVAFKDEIRRGATGGLPASTMSAEERALPQAARWLLEHNLRGRLVLPHTNNNAVFCAVTPLRCPFPVKKEGRKEC